MKNLNDLPLYPQDLNTQAKPKSQPTNMINNNLLSGLLGTNVLNSLKDNPVASLLSGNTPNIANILGSDSSNIAQTLTNLLNNKDQSLTNKKTSPKSSDIEFEEF